MTHGGARKGAGRKSVAEEEKTREKAKAAIMGVYGSIEDGFKSLLKSGDATLIRFVFEHAAGKPQDHIDLTTNGENVNQVQEVIVRDYTKKID